MHPSHTHHSSPRHCHIRVTLTSSGHHSRIAQYLSNSDTIHIIKYREYKPSTSSLPRQQSLPTWLRPYLQNDRHITNSNCQHRAEARIQTSEPNPSLVTFIHVYIFYATVHLFILFSFIFKKMKKDRETPHLAPRSVQ